MNFNEEANIRCLMKFSCPQLWDRLVQTDSPDRRHCGECKRDVFLVHDEEDFARHAAQGHCVAVRLQSEVGCETDDKPLTGVPVEPGEWEIFNG